MDTQTEQAPASPAVVAAADRAEAKSKAPKPKPVSKKERAIKEGNAKLATQKNVKGLDARSSMPGVITEEISDEAAAKLGELTYRGEDDLVTRAKLPTEAGRKLHQNIERIERLREEMDSLASDIREIMADMKGEGFDMAAVRDVIKLRRMDENWQERIMMIRTYAQSIGMGWPS